MARTVIPDPLGRRHLLEREIDVKQARRIAEAYLAEGRGVEAVAFLHRAGDGDGLAGLREEAIREGDAFLLRELERALGEEADAGDWRRLAAAASERGKERYAEDARRRATREEG